MRTGLVRHSAMPAVCSILALAAGCGAFTNPDEFASIDTVDKTCLDLWSLVHFGSGYYIGRGLDDEGVVDTVALLTAYEGFEPHFWPGADETQLNQECDIVVGTIGWLFQSLSQ